MSSVSSVTYRGQEVGTCVYVVYLVCVQYCWSAGGHLAEIQSSYEEDLLDQLLPRGSLHWIGLTDLASEGGKAALE